MDAVEFRALFEWLVLRFCFSVLAALFVAFVCLKAYGLAGHLKADARRYGWPFAALFIVCSAWAAYTAFPTSEEKQAYLDSKAEQDAVNKAWSDVLFPSGQPAEKNGSSPGVQDCDFAPVRTGTDGCHGFTPPENAVVCGDWLRYGGCEDWIYLGPGGWSFRHGSNFVERIAAFSSGRIRLLKQGGGRFC